MDSALITQHVFGLIFLSIGVFLSWRVWRNVREVKASRSWPFVPGRVIGASCREDVIRGGSDSSDSDTTWYVPLVQYEYEVGGQAYRGNRIGFSEERQVSREKAFQVLEAFPVGHPVTVFYDPAKPRDAILQRANRGNIFLAVAAWVLVAAGLAMLFSNRMVED
jgi:hypothetical protein